MNYEILTKNKELLLSMQERLKRWLRLICNNVLHFSEEKTELKERHLSFDGFERLIRSS